MKIGCVVQRMLLIVSVVLTLAARPSAAEFTSYAVVRDDGSLLIRNKVVRLFGVYIPNRHAVSAMNSWTNGFITCEEVGTYDDGSTAAVCWKRGTDIGASLIRQGVALAGPDAPFDYHAMERIAQSNGMGIWGSGGQQIIIRQGNVIVRKQTTVR